MVRTRREGKKAAENTEDAERGREEMEELQDEPLEEGDSEEVVISEHRETGDLLWDQLSRLPFFKAASMEEQKSMYFEEARRREEKEEERRREALVEARRREDREFELKRLEIQSRSESASNTSDQTTAAPYRSKVKLPDWDPNSTIDAYLDVCESLLEVAEVPATRWVGHLVPKLPHEARAVYKCLDREDRNDYAVLKRELLTHYAVSAAA